MKKNLTNTAINAPAKKGESILTTIVNAPAKKGETILTGSGMAFKTKALAFILTAIASCTAIVGGACTFKTAQAVPI